MFFCIEAIEELMLLQGIAAGESISRTIAGKVLPEQWLILIIWRFERLEKLLRRSDASAGS